MNLINNKNWLRSRVIKSLLLIVGLQLVVLQVKALTMPVSMNHGPCNEMVMGQDQHSHSQKTDLILDDELQTVSCSLCGDANLDCYNSCNTASLITLSFDTALNLIHQNNSFPPKTNSTFLAVPWQPLIKPPRLLIV